MCTDIIIKIIILPLKLWPYHLMDYYNEINSYIDGICKTTLKFNYIFFNLYSKYN
jgi:hypothetical protein